MLGAIAFPWCSRSCSPCFVRRVISHGWRTTRLSRATQCVSVQQFVLAVTFLPHQAVVSGDAIIRTLIRLKVTKRNLLEWQTASQVERAMSRSRLEVWRRMWPVVVIALSDSSRGRDRRSRLRRRCDQGAPSVSRRDATADWPLAGISVPLLSD